MNHTGSSLILVLPVYDLPNGIYYYTIQTGSDQITGTIIIAK
jgi:hypothetical protein